MGYYRDSLLRRGPLLWINPVTLSMDIFSDHFIIRGHYCNITEKIIEQLQ